MDALPSLQAVYREDPDRARRLPRPRRRMRPGQVQMWRAAARGLAYGGVAVVDVAVPADPPERGARVVLTRLCPAGEPRYVGPRAARARLDVHGQSERVLAEPHVAHGREALGDAYAVAADEVQHVGEDAAVHARPGLARHGHPAPAAGDPGEPANPAGRPVVHALAAHVEGIERLGTHAVTPGA